MSFVDYLDYWMKTYCEVNLRYNTIQAYKNIIKNHIKPRLVFYRLSQITTATLQEFINDVYVKHGAFEGTDTCKYPFKVIHYELEIPGMFHDFRDTHATRLIEAGADIKAVSKRLGHSTIETTYNIYVKMEYYLFLHLCHLLK